MTVIKSVLLIQECKEKSVLNNRLAPLVLRSYSLEEPAKQFEKKINVW